MWQAIGLEALHQRLLHELVRVPGGVVSYSDLRPRPSTYLHGLGCRTHAT
jgi:hypothetical protein